jgi:SAM-dependent methyltransferase
VSAGADLESLIAAWGRGSCNVCGNQDGFSVPDAPPESWNLRESLPCPGCGSVSRERALVTAFARVCGERRPLAQWPARPEVRLFETSGYRGHPPLLAERFDYFNTAYVGLDELPENVDGRTQANLEDLPYPDGFFDFVLSAEVLEHVAELDPALRELHRVLAPSGTAVLQAPYVHAWERNATRSVRWHERDVHLYPPEYHSEESLVYRVYGRELLHQLAAVGFTVGHLSLDVPEHAIVAQDLIIATRMPYLELSRLG